MSALGLPSPMLARPSIWLGGSTAPLAPDWVCEVLSPSTAVLDREKKMRAYAREGVSHLWLVDPLQQALEVYRLEGSRWSQQGTWKGQGLVRAEPFEALELKLGVLWTR